jgi:heme/copper-type cytochrome/quinol oxidase subunit 2
MFAEQQTIAVPTTVLTLLIGATIFVLGFAWAVMRRANADYKAVKSAVKSQRSKFWSAWWTAMKRAFLVLAIGVALIVWSGYEIRHNGDDADQHQVPTTVTSPSARPRR